MGGGLPAISSRLNNYTEKFTLVMLIIILYSDSYQTSPNKKVVNWFFFIIPLCFYTKNYIV